MSMEWLGEKLCEMCAGIYGCLCCFTSSTFQSDEGAVEIDEGINAFDSQDLKVRVRGSSHLIIHYLPITYHRHRYIYSSLGIELVLSC